MPVPSLIVEIYALVLSYAFLLCCALPESWAMAWDSILSFSEGGGVVALLDPSSGMLIIASPGREARAVGYPYWHGHYLACSLVLPRDCGAGGD